MLLIGTAVGIVVPAFAATNPANANIDNVYCDPATEVNVPDNPSNPGGPSHSCCPKTVSNPDSRASCLFAKYVNPTIKLLSGLVGLVVIIGIVSGAIQYASSAGDPQKASAGKARITKAIYAFIVFLFLFSALQFIAPGGISGTKALQAGEHPSGKACASDFLGLKPWFAYLPASSFDQTVDSYDSGTQTYSCSITNFSLFGDSATGKKSDLLPVFLVVIDDLMRIIGLVAVAYVIIGGIQYVTSQGEPDRTKHAQETIINALIGLAIAIVAASVVSFIGNRIG